MAGESSHDGTRPADAAVSPARGVQAHGPCVGLEGDGISPAELHEQGLGEEGVDGLGSVGIPKQLPPMVKAAAMARKYVEGILNAIVLKTTNAAAESMNTRIKRIDAMTCGHRNRERFRNAILLQPGGLDLYPRIASTHTDY